MWTDQNVISTICKSQAPSNYYRYKAEFTCYSTLYLPRLELRIRAFVSKTSSTRERQGHTNTQYRRQGCQEDVGFRLYHCRKKSCQASSAFWLLPRKTKSRSRDTASRRTTWPMRVCRLGERITIQKERYDRRGIQLQF